MRAPLLWLAGRPGSLGGSPLYRSPERGGDSSFEAGEAELDGGPQRHRHGSCARPTIYLVFLDAGPAPEPNYFWLWCVFPVNVFKKNIAIYK